MIIALQNGLPFNSAFLRTIVLAALLTASFTMAPTRNARGQTISQAEADQIRNDLYANRGTELSKLRQRLALTEFYLSRKKPRTDSAFLYLNLADTIAKRKGTEADQTAVTMLRVKALLADGDTTKSSALFRQILSRYHKEGNKQAEAEMLYKYACSRLFETFYSFQPYSYSGVRKSGYLQGVLQDLTRSGKLAAEISDRQLEARAQLQIAYALYYQREMDKAQAIVNSLILFYKQHKLPGLYEVYTFNSRLENYKGRYTLAIKYGLDALRAAEAEKETQRLICIYPLLIENYHRAEMTDEAIKAYSTYKVLQKQPGRQVDPLYLFLFAKISKKLGEQKELIRTLNDINPDNRFYGSADRMNVFDALAELNESIGDYALAQQYHYKARANAALAPPLVKLRLDLDLGVFYSKWGKYDSAAVYLNRVLDPANHVAEQNLRTANLYAFKVDSARSDYGSALKHFKEYYRLQDKLSGVEVKSRIQDLRLAYETEKKEQDIFLLRNKLKLEQVLKAAREKDIKLLKNKVRLRDYETAVKERDIVLLRTKVNLAHFQSADKEKSILLLKNEAKMQQNNLQKSKLIRNVMIIGTALLVTILLLLYRQILLKKHANDQIARKNTELTTLVHDKEMLMKEIHHRVKNNLHIVTSLLESQAAFLSDDALSAIQDSRQRVEAMSLVHQKLYLTDNVNLVDMSTYIRELVSFLRESFGIRSNIAYTLDIDPVGLEIAKAIPLGLIINETVTNSVKYAFPDNRPGEIRISLKYLTDRLVVFSVTDNGIGMPEQVFATTELKSLGMELIRGLSNDMEGQLEITVANGTCIKLSFDHVAKNEIEASSFDGRI